MWLHEERQKDEKVGKVEFVHRAAHAIANFR